MVDAVLAFVSEHRDWAFLVAFAISFAETLLVVSAVVPTTAILIGAGGIAGTGALDFEPIFAGAALGSILGSIASWTIGRVFGMRLLAMSAVRRRIGSATRVRRAFLRWGDPVVAVGHLAGPFRSVAFTMAGLSAMPLWRFVPMTVIGAVAWAYLTPLAGQVGFDLIGWLF